VLGVIAFGTTARAANLTVTLPQQAAVRVYDRDRPDAPRIDCPGTCSYQVAGSGIDLSQLNVDVLPDPRTGDPPWDLVAMTGCRGTSALPADNGICFLPSEGNVALSFQVQYRPVVAVKVGGTIGGPLSHFFITGGPAADNSPIVGFSCDAVAPLVQACAKHQRHGATIGLSAPSTLQATLDAVSSPCGSGNCTFPVDADTCVAYLYRNGAPLLYPDVEIGGPECPTGPGIGGGGGGGGTNPPPELDPIKSLALEQMRHELAQSLAPCLTAGTTVSLFALGPIGVLTGRLVFAPAAGICARIVQHLAELQRVYDDPPDPAFRTIAPVAATAVPPVDLSPCKEVTGKDRRTCVKLGKAAHRHVASLFHVGDVIIRASRRRRARQRGRRGQQPEGVQTPGEGGDATRAAAQVRSGRSRESGREGRGDPPKRGGHGSDRRGSVHRSVGAGPPTPRRSGRDGERCAHGARSGAHATAHRPAGAAPPTLGVRGLHSILCPLQ
jgi:hypothetical protein